MILEPQPEPEPLEHITYEQLRQAFQNIGFRVNKRSLESYNYVEGVSGWRLDSNTGIVYATRLQLADFVVHTDPSITFTGTWASQTTQMLFNGTRRKSVVIGDEFSIAFRGTSIGLIAERASNLGKVEIYIDDVLMTTVDLYNSSSYVRSIVYQTTALANTDHVLRGVIVARNASSSAEGIGLQGYTLYPNPGIKLEQLSCDMLFMTFSVETDANGYVAFAASTPVGYSVYAIVGVSLTAAIMSDATLTDPKLGVTTSTIYLYNGAATTTYSVQVTRLISAI